MILYIVRHGETEWNKVRKMQGQTDIPLAKEGIDMARESAKKIKDLPIDLIISSPLKRAVETAKLMTEGRDIPIVTDERIAEISFGDYEGERILESTIIPEDFRKTFFEDPYKLIAPPNGESFADVIKRTNDFWEEILNTPKYQDKHIFISTHGAASRCLLTYFYEDKTDLWRGNVPPNCSITTVEYTKEGANILSLDKVYYEGVKNGWSIKQ